MAKRDMNPRKGELQNKKTSWGRFFTAHSRMAWNLFFAAIFMSGATYLVLPKEQPGISKLNAGDIAPRNFRAGFDTLVKDEEATKRKIEEASLRARPVYDLDIEASERVAKDINSVFKVGRSLLREVTMERNKPSTSLNRDMEREKEQAITATFQETFNKNFGVNLSPEAIRLLFKDRFSAVTESTLVRILSGVLDEGVIAHKTFLRQAQNGIAVRILKTGEEDVIQDTANIVDAEMAQEIMAWQVDNYLQNEELQGVVLRLASVILQPNLTFNKSETDSRMDLLKESTSPVYIQVKAGEIIVREGEKVSSEQMMKINQIFAEDQQVRPFNRALGFFILNVLVMFLIWIFLSWYHPEVLNKRSDVALLLTLLLTAMIMTRLSFNLAHPVTSSFPDLKVESLYYGLPIAFAPWLVAMLVSTPAAFILSIFCPFYANLILNGGVSYLLVFAAASFLAAYLGSTCQQRTTFFRIGSFVGILNAGFIIAHYLTRADFLSVDTIHAVLFGFSSGPISALIVSGALPILEHLFNKTTDIKLLELSNPTQPLLKKMVVEAPGTYHHSIMVANLAEAAAELIGAKPLLARIASYYHDIGKIKKPDYFIENNHDGRSRHVQLSPRMSSLILISHVKDGLELAKAYKLPEVVLDAIRQHHGTSLITFFYNKAKENETRTSGYVNESDFRYPGLKPRTKENAIVMLADQVEAACRALPDTSPSRIKSVVKRIINNIYMDRQLNECNITLKDLEIIEQEFTRVLVGTYHQRLDYPVVVDGKIQEGISVGDKKSAKEGKARPATC